MKWLTTNRLKQGYRLGLFIKGLDGALETAGGIFILLVPSQDLRGLITNWSTSELSQDRHNLIGTWLLHLDQRLTHGLALFAAIYLIAHGIIKLVLAVALIKEKRWAFPPAIAILLAFIVYQAYRVGYDHSVALAGLTALDAAIVALVIWDYRRLRRNAYTNKGDQNA